MEAETHWEGNRRVLSTCSRHRSYTLALVRRNTAEELFFCEDVGEPHFILANGGKVLDDALYMIYGTTAGYYLKNRRMARP